MRRRARIDSNHATIVTAFRDAGASVLSLASVGSGCPDLLVGFRSRNYLVEVKDGSRPPSERRLTPDQELFHFRWRGQVVVVDSVDRALELLQKWSL